MGSIFELPIPFDILDQAVERCLSGYTVVLVAIQRDQSPTGTVTYHMTQQQLGDVGTLTLYKKTDRITELHFADPQRPKSRKPSPEEWAQMTALADPEEQFQAKVKLFRKVDNEARELHTQRKQHHELAVEAFFNYLIDEYGHLYQLFTDDHNHHTERKEHLDKLIRTYTRRLQFLELKVAMYGASVDPAIPIEIEDIQAELQRLHIARDQL